MDTSLSSILELALQQGIWAALYIYLFFRMLNQNETRETQYQTIIQNLNESIVQGIEDIQTRLNDIEEKLPSEDESRSSIQSTTGDQ